MAADKFEELLDREKPSITNLLAPYQKPERFFTLVYEFFRDPALRNCTPESKLKCVADAANCGLEIGGPDKHCGVIPYGTEAQLQVFYQGIIYRLVKAKIVKHMYAVLVHENDFIEVRQGTRPELNHRPKMFGERGKLVGSYAVAFLPNGMTDFEIMELDDLRAVESAALRLAQRNDKHTGKTSGPSPAWRFFPGEMQKKSAIRRLAKRLQGDRSMSDDESRRLAAVLEHDNHSFDLSPEPEDEDLPTAESASAGTADNMVLASPSGPVISPPTHRLVGPIRIEKIPDNDDVAVKREMEHEIIKLAKAAKMERSDLEQTLEFELGITDPAEVPPHELRRITKAIAEWGTK